MYNKIDVTSPVRKFQNPIRNCFNSSVSAEAANALSAWKSKKDVEILNALTREEAFGGENVFWIDDDESDDDDFFVSALSTKSSPDFDLETNKFTLACLLLPLKLEVLFEEAAMQKLLALLLHDKANMI